MCPHYICCSCCCFRSTHVAPHDTDNVALSCRLCYCIVDCLDIRISWPFHMTVPATSLLVFGLDPSDTRKSHWVTACFRFHNTRNISHRHFFSSVPGLSCYPLSKVPKAIQGLWNVWCVRCVPIEAYPLNLHCLLEEVVSRLLLQRDVTWMQSRLTDRFHTA